MIYREKARVRMEKEWRESEKGREKIEKIWERRIQVMEKERRERMLERMKKELGENDRKNVQIKCV